MYVYTTASGKSRRLLAQSTTAPSSASQMGYVLHILLDSSTANALLTCSARARNSLCILLAAKTVRFVTSHLRHQKKKKWREKGEKNARFYLLLKEQSTVCHWTIDEIAMQGVLFSLKQKFIRPLCPFKFRHTVTPSTVHKFYLIQVLLICILGSLIHWPKFHPNCNALAGAEKKCH